MNGDWAIIDNCSSLWRMGAEAEEERKRARVRVISAQRSAIASSSLLVVLVNPSGTPSRPLCLSWSLSLACLDTRVRPVLIVSHPHYYKLCVDNHG
jgi:hypothetical protein